MNWGGAFMIVTVLAWDLRFFFTYREKSVRRADVRSDTLECI